MEVNNTGNGLLINIYTIVYL